MSKGIEAESSSSAWDQLCRHFSIDEIRSATRNFDEGLVVGTGGFGKVYKATLENGGVAAIKRLDYSMSSQGEPQFVAEIETLSKLRHCHLVSLIGYCNDGQEMILVYEFMPNGTLEEHRSRLSWSQRLKICLGAARGLDYLHTGTGTKHGVIHRDVKSSNILLDHNWDAKISDFGLSKIGPTNQTNSFVKTGVRGTFGYIDPCYFSTGRLTRNSDVYSFGVVLFELLCGRAAVDKALDEEQWGLAGWVQKCIRDKKLVKIVDSSIRDQISPKSLMGFIRIAGCCLDNNQDKRPTMAKVVVKLVDIVSLQERMNSLPAKLTIKEKMLSFFSARTHVILGPVVISDEKRSLQPTDIHFDPNDHASIESLQVDFETIRVATDNFSEANKSSTTMMLDEKRSLEPTDIHFDLNDDASIESLHVDFETIRVATDNFSEANMVVDVLRSCVYKGRLQNGQGIAVEKFHTHPVRLLDNILSLMVKLRHRNVVRIVGYCVDQEHKTLFLIYNFFPYANLHGLIHDIHVKESACLDWHKLRNIIIHVAQGLHYIHEDCPSTVPLHGVAPNMILLDESLDPKIFCFDFVWCLRKVGNRVFSDEWDYPVSMDHSHKSNVCSFGILLLNIIRLKTRPAYFNTWSNKEDLVDVWSEWQAGNFTRLIDPKLQGDSSFVMRFIQIGLLCVQPDKDYRPTMGSVVLMLTNSSVDLPIPKRPM